MSKIEKLSSRKEYVFLSSGGILYIMKFSTKKGKRYVHQKKTDVAERLEVKFNIPMEGYFTWPYSVMFGPKSGIELELLSEL